MALGLAVTGCGGSSDPQVDHTITSSADAAGSQGGGIQLPGTAKKGQQAAGKYDMTASFEIDGVSGAPEEPQKAHLRIAFASKVVDTADDGGYTAKITIKDIDVVDASAMMKDELESELSGVTTFSLEQEYGADGSSQGEPEVVNGSIDPEQEELVNKFVENIASTPASYPDHRVAVGDTWESKRHVTKNGVDVTVTTHYTLKKLTEDTFTITYAQDLPIDTTVDSNGEEVDVSGHLEGSGTLVGSTTNPLHIAVEGSETVDMDVGEGSDSLDMTIKVDFNTTLK